MIWINTSLNKACNFHIVNNHSGEDGSRERHKLTRTTTALIMVRSDFIQYNSNTIAI